MLTHGNIEGWKEDGGFVGDCELELAMIPLRQDSSVAADAVWLSCFRHQTEHESDLRNWKEQR